MPRCHFCVFVFLIYSAALLAQDHANLTVTVNDPSAAMVPGASVTATDLARGRVMVSETKEGGYAIFDRLAPGDYSIDIIKAGFSNFRIDRLTLNVRDRQTLRVELQVAGAAGTRVQVTDRPEALSSDAAQGISVDQSYVRFLPANGRNAESLILMAPGVTTAAGGKGDGGFNANGLRSNTNYYTLDGVSLNRGMGGGMGGGGFGGRGGGPPIAAAGAGSSTEMISIDAMQEMRVQTSSFAPEFGRTPGAQIVMTSRGGSNQFHGALFYYLRNERFDANDWFANAGGYARGRERQKRPGGTLGGPIRSNRTFFFVSYEQLDLEAPTTVIATVPDLATRAAASAALRPYLNAFPRPNGKNLDSGGAEFRAVISNPSENQSGSLRIDHLLTSRTTMFARYSLTPSSGVRRGSDATSPNMVTSQSSRSHLATVGATHAFSGGAINDLRVNYSRSSASGYSLMDTFGGAVPLTPSQIFPQGVTADSGSFSLNIMGFAGYSYGGRSSSQQAQVNVVNSYSKVSGPNSYKAGVDYRQIGMTNHRLPYSVSASFNGLVAEDSDSDNYFLKGVALNGQVSSSLAVVYPTYTNFSAYAQNTWRATDRTTLTYGLRWDVNPAPTTRQGPRPFALSSSSIAGVTQNELIYPTRWTDIAPRFGVAYLSDPTPGREMMLRAGVGLFYDTGYGVTMGAFNGAPYSNVRTISEVKFPLSATDIAPPKMPPTRPYGQITAGPRIPGGSGSDSVSVDGECVRWRNGDSRGGMARCRHDRHNRSRGRRWVCLRWMGRRLHRSGCLPGDDG